MSRVAPSQSKISCILLRMFTALPRNGVSRGSAVPLQTGAHQARTAVVQHPGLRAFFVFVLGSNAWRVILMPASFLPSSAGAVFPHNSYVTPALMTPLCTYMSSLGNP